MTTAIKQQIKDSIHAFSSSNLTENSLNLFKTLGYNTERQGAFSTKTYQYFIDSFVDGNNGFKEDKALINQWAYVDLLFQLSEEEMKKQVSLFDTKKVIISGDSKVAMESYLFFVIGLSGSGYSRTDLSRITREINRLFPMPVMILFKTGGSLTLSVTNRRLHKKDESKDVLEKVTLIKDIRIENPHRAHIEILFDLSFDELHRKNRFTNFIELHNAWQKTLDTKELNKRFFRELSNWYFWAMKQVSFPDDVEKNEDVRNATNLIRLITRIIFIWFIKEKSLVPDVLFDEAELKKILKDFNSKSSNSYYKAILQNLFFGTLNQKMGERSFAKEGKNDFKISEYGVKNLFRYAAGFAIKPEEAIAMFKDIPFLNGGLFDCLDKENDAGKVLYTDGFSRNPNKQADVPDLLFFGKEQEIDLSETYGDKKRKKEKVKGLFNILTSYKFTIAENTPIEEEVALDPELLGKVFENLLASYNPETQTTARKQTGSFYTPREIVNYMVDKSLKAYLKQKLENEAGMNAADAGVALAFLFEYNEKEHLFDGKQVAVLINAIDTCKILDPACGSGAFPMGILHKLVHILHKLDPNNEQWKERQLEKVRKIEDACIRDNSINDIEEAFTNNEFDYGRKLYLIENCIFGVDIQPIAVQIAKLRFFISLVVDQKKQYGKENFGIRALPNLETKFVAANTLIGIDKPKQIGLPSSPKIRELEAELKDLRHEYFSAKTRKDKLNCQKKDKELRKKISELLVKDGWDNKSAEQIAAFDPYDQNASSPFFEPEWMFGIKDGFDVVIGNPPYGAEIKESNIKNLVRNYKYFDRQKNSASFFLELAANLCGKKKGTVTFIVPKSLSFSEGWKSTRELVSIKNQLNALVDVSKAFEGVLLEQIIVCFQIKIPDKEYHFLVGEGWSGSVAIFSTLDSSLIKEMDILPVYVDIFKRSIYSKMTDNAVPLSKISDTFRGLPAQKFLSEKGEPILRGKNIGKYSIYGNIDNVLLDAKHRKKTKNILQHKIISQNIVAHVINPIERIIIMATIDDMPFLTLDTVMNTIIKDDKFDMKYVLAILNSTLASWFFYWFVYNRAIRTMHFDNYYIGKLPIKIISGTKQNSFIEIVDKNLSLTKSVNYLQNPDKQAQVKEYEKHIDRLVYDLYSLTEEEIKIVEGVK